MDAFTLERFKQVPQRSDLFFIGGVVTEELLALMQTDEEEDGRLVAWVGPSGELPPMLRTGRPEEDVGELLFDALVDWVLGEDGPGFRPMEVRLSDPGLADALRPRLLAVGVSCVVSEDFDRLQHYLRMEMSRASGLLRVLLSGPLAGRNVTAKQMHSFAEAGRVFYEAELRLLLTCKDLIEIRNPRPPAGFRYVCVAGSDGNTNVVVFFHRIDDFQGLASASSVDGIKLAANKWCLVYHGKDRIPRADARLWEEHQWPVSDSGKYPVLMKVGPNRTVRRPATRQLAFVTGLLHALAATRPADLDAAEWIASGPGPDGPARYEFRLLPSEVLNRSVLGSHAGASEDVFRYLEAPIARIEREVSRRNLRSAAQVNRFLKAYDRNPPEPNAITPLEQAQDIMYEAWATHGWRRRRLAERALAVCSDCADAYVALAEARDNSEAAVALFREGLDAGKRSLPQKEIDRYPPGGLWLLTRARPLLRAMVGLAYRLCDLGQFEEASKHCRRALQLDSDDHLEARYCLAGCLLQLGRDRELRRLIETYGDPDEAYWLYMEALAIYRMEGDTPLARKRRAQAVRTNRLVAGFLRNGPDHAQAVIGDAPDVDGDDESWLAADEIASWVADAWNGTPGALDWLDQQGSF